MRRIMVCICVVTGLAVAAFSGTAQNAPRYVEGEVIVTFKPSVTLDSARRTLNGRTMVLAKHFAFLSQRRRRQMGLVRRSGRTTAQLIAELKQDPSVETAEPNYVRHLNVHLPNDPLFPQLWALQNTGQTVNGSPGTTGHDIKFNAAWNLARSSTNEVVVAVIDSGVDFNHPDLINNIWTNPGENPTNNADDDANSFVDDVHGWDFADSVSDPSDSGFHGTHVAGTIAASGNNQTGVIGVDYQAKIMALKASNDGESLTDSAIIDALQYATMMKERGVNIVAINASFTGPDFDSVMLTAIQVAGDAGIIFCAAAGNESTNNDLTPSYPASYGLSNMIVVAASDQNDDLASFSNFGVASVDLAAPGVNILSLLPVNLGVALIQVRQGVATYTANALAFSGMTTGITATIYNCGLGYPTNFPPGVSNNIALISRGTLLFSDKVANATAAGAQAAIIYNNAPGNFLGTLGVASNWIPAITLSQADGLDLQAALPAPGTVVNSVDPASVYQFLDGTSMATPHVCGAVAFAAMNFPDETVAQRIARVLANVDPVPGLQGLVRTGGRLNLQRVVDTDGNALPDWWEQMYFGQLTGVDPSADPDHDGASNLAEWLSGTDPTNASSSLRLTAQNSNSNSVVILWPSAPGKFYTLERATNLTTGFNTTVRTNITATAPTNTESDPAILPGNTRFYRVRVEP